MVFNSCNGALFGITGYICIHFYTGSFGIQYGRYYHRTGCFIDEFYILQTGE